MIQLRTLLSPVLEFRWSGSCRANGEGCGNRPQTKTAAIKYGAALESEMEALVDMANITVKMKYKPKSGFNVKEKAEMEAHPISIGIHPNNPFHDTDPSMS